MMFDASVRRRRRKNVALILISLSWRALGARLLLRGGAPGATGGARADGGRNAVYDGRALSAYTFRESATDRPPAKTPKKIF